MSTTKRPSFAKVMTGLGTLIYPKIKTPDFKFKPEVGEFQAKLRLSPEDSDKIIEKYNAELAKYWPTAVAEYEEKVANAKTGADKAKAKKALEAMKEADRPWKPSYDDEGNETGEMEFNFKSPASFLKDKGKATEKKMPIVIDVFDAAGKKLKVIPEIWSGSTAYIAAELRPFSMPIGVGLSLRLKAVQLIDVVSGGSGSKDASGYGFGKQEGFAGSDEEESTFPARAGGEDSDGGDDAPLSDDF